MCELLLLSPEEVRAGGHAREPRPPAILHTLEATPRLLETILAPAASAHFDWKPSATRWSISEVLAHLVVVEEKVLGLRVRRIETEDLPLLESYDQNEQAALGVYSGFDGRERLAAFARARSETLAWLRRIPAARWTREARHPEVGVVRMSQFLHLWAFHDLGHLRQITELFRAQAFWDGIGSLQRYYSVNP